MAELQGRPCPQCNTFVPGGQRFCSNCGVAIENAALPYPQSSGAHPVSYASSAQQPGGYQVVPPYAQASQQSQVGEAIGAIGLWYMLRRLGWRRHAGRHHTRSSGCCGCLVALVILAVVFGGIVYATRVVRPSAFTSGFSDITSAHTLKQPPITTTAINQTITYASVDITLINVQQSSAFLDDPDTNQTGMVRLNIREHNAASSGSYYYGDAVHLLLPDGNSVAPVSEKYGVKADAGVTRMNWLDFPVPMSYKGSQMTVRWGTENETQMDVPLTGHADVSKYQPKTVSPNVATTYGGMKWTITSATSSLSFKGTQAKKGVQFVMLTVKVDNPTSTDFNSYWGDYIRLQAGDSTSSPTTDTNFPLGFASGTSGSTGTIVFEVPQGNSSYTLLLLKRDEPHADQATADFHL